MCLEFAHYLHTGNAGLNLNYLQIKLGGFSNLGRKVRVGIHLQN